MNKRLRTAAYRRVVIWAGVALIATVAEGSRVRPLNIEALTERAATIVVGSCVAVRNTIDATTGLSMEETTLAVERWVKGHGGATLVVRSLAHAGSGTDIAPCREGEEVVLFLYGTSPLGLTSPVGLGQGRFTLVADKQGRRLAQNPLGNETLMKGLSPESLQRLAGTLAPDAAKRGVDVDTLLQAVDRLLDVRVQP